MMMVNTKGQKDKLLLCIIKTSKHDKFLQNNIEKHEKLVYRIIKLCSKIKSIEV